MLGREIKPATIEEDGYLVEYKDGYKSWSPKSVFEEAYREVGSVNFGCAIDLLKVGFAVRRKGWNGKGLFIVKQVPSHIGGDIIPKMQSLPQSAKDILMSRENPHIDYTNQMLIINTIKEKLNNGTMKFVPFTHVLFKNGYYDDSPRIEKEIVSITIGKPKKGLCPDKWFDKDFFIIKFK